MCNILNTPLNNRSNDQSVKSVAVIALKKSIIMEIFFFFFIEFFFFQFSHLGENYKNTPVAFSEGCIHPERIPQQGTVSCIGVTRETHEFPVFSFVLYNLKLLRCIEKKKRKDNFMQRRVPGTFIIK